MKHTQGEWTTKKTTEDFTLTIKKGATVIDNDNALLAIVSGDSIDEMIPNAKLIAAAPDMLEALMEIVEVMPNILRLPLTNQIKDIATQAIKKATE